MKTGYHIEHQCPQCGAPALLDETDRLFTCKFCRVKSYLTRDDFFRYILPQKTTGQDLFFFPYWRYKGTLFSCTSDGLDERVVDASLQGVPSRHVPVSVGLRAQTLNLQFAPLDTEYKFIKPSISAADALAQISKRYRISPGKKLFHQEFIGDTLSLIYSPFYIKDLLYDAILDKPVSFTRPASFDISNFESEPPHWPVRFIATICPHCGWDLSGERDSLVLVCSNCESLWQSSGDKLTKVHFGCLASEFTPDQYLPFWRTTAEISGISLASYADLVKVANLPKVIQAGWESRQFHFWSPAFKIRPKLYTRLSRRLTLSQPEEPPEPMAPVSKIHPITLPPQEAIESAKVTLADIMSPRAKMLPLLSDIEITPLQSHLVLIPFQNKRHELTNPDYHLTVNHNVLQFANSL